MAAKKTASAKKTAPKKTATKKSTKKAATKKAVAKRAPRVNRSPAPAPVVEKVGLNETGIFHVRAEFNDEVHEGFTDSIADAVLSMKADLLNTRVILKFSLAGDRDGLVLDEDGARVNEEGKVVDKVLMIPYARRLFINKMAAAVFEKGIKLALGYDDNGEETQ